MKLVDCELDAEFIKYMKLMMKSHPLCICDDDLMIASGPMSLEDFAKHIKSGAAFNINRYALESGRRQLNKDDFIKIFQDTRHIMETWKKPEHIFADTLNPIKITLGDSDDNKFHGKYLGRDQFLISGLYDPKGKIKRGNIVLAHFSMIICVIDADKEREILEHQAKDKKLMKVYQQIDNGGINYSKIMNNIFAWTKETYQKYRS